MLHSFRASSLKRCLNSAYMLLKRSACLEAHTGVRSFFSVMKMNKKLHKRSRLTDAHLRSILRVSTAQKLTSNVDELAAKKKRCQTSGSSTCSYEKNVANEYVCTLSNILFNKPCLALGIVTVFSFGPLCDWVWHPCTKVKYQVKLVKNALNVHLSC